MFKWNNSLLPSILCNALVTSSNEDNNKPNYCIKLSPLILLFKTEIVLFRGTISTRKTIPCSNLFVRQICELWSFFALIKIFMERIKQLIIHKFICLFDLLLLSIVLISHPSPFMRSAMGNLLIDHSFTWFRLSVQFLIEKSTSSEVWKREDIQENISLTPSGRPKFSKIGIDVTPLSDRLFYFSLFHPRKCQRESECKEEKMKNQRGKRQKFHQFVYKNSPIITMLKVPRCSKQQT